MLMFILLVMLAGSIPYLAVGAPYARRRYALAVHERNQYLPMLNQSKTNYEQAKSKRANLKHQSHCFLNYSCIKHEGCKNCNQSEEWRALTQVMEAETQNIKSVPKPTNPFIIMVGWPVVLLNTYLTSGTVDKPDYSRIAELEALNNIKELS